jgi:hypothetical protein
VETAPESDTESLLWTCKECYVYQIPPLKNESGHRANDWDVNKWLWSGALKVTARGSTLSIILHDPATAEVFACCPVTEKGSKAVDPVVDSSRYFALRIDNGQGKHAFVGMGFRDRSHSYDFNATLQVGDALISVPLCTFITLTRLLFRMRCRTTGKVSHGKRKRKKCAPRWRHAQRRSRCVTCL